MHPSPELLSLLALGERNAATPAELDHILTCALCTAEIDDLTKLVALGRTTAGLEGLQTPPPSVWNGVLADITAAENGPASQPVPAPQRSWSGGDWADSGQDDRGPTHPSTPIFAVPGRKADVVPLPRRRRRRPLVAIAAAVALLVGGAAGYGIARTLQPGTTVLARAELAATPSWAGSSATAVLRRNADGQRILTLDLAASKPLSGTQVVWLVDPSRPSAPMQVGLMDLSKGIWSVPADVDVSQYRLIDVSEEPVGDTDPAHSGNSIVRGPLE